MTLDAGSRLGPYEITGALGSGGMGEVYRAHDPRLGRDVALKILPEAMAKDPEGLARFTREARAVAALNHPHIVTIHSIEEADGIRFMTMELIEGRTLDRVIPESGVSLAQFFDVSMAIADALAAAHHKLITHRDLKPANVMVTDAGRVKVLDFGLARGGEGSGSGASTLEEEATLQKLTRAGTILGTMPYMSPEQIEARPLDGRSDIFSLGIVMYEMATGGRPFRGESSPALMSSIMREHPKPASELRPDLPGDVSRLVLKCLEKDTRDRMQTAHEILLELKALRRAWESGASSLRPTAATRAVPSGPQGTSLRIAVLPFVPRPASGDAESLADGLTDDVTAGLARFPNMRVVSRREVDHAKGKAADQGLAAQLGARYLLDGTVRVAGNSFRVSANLTDMSTGTHMWAETYERSLSDDVFALQDDIAHRVIATVADSSGVLVRSMGSALKDRPWTELTTLELLIRFEGYVQRYRADEHAILRDALEAAVERDPLDAEAWATLSAVVSHEYLFGFNPRPDTLGRTRSAANRAIEIDSACHRGWLLLACAHFIDRDLTGLRAAADRVIEINPLDTAKLAILAWLLVGAGDMERGVAVARQSMALHSNFAAWYRMPVFSARYVARDYRAALEEAKRVNIDTYRYAHLATACAAGQLGSASDAKASLATLARIQGAPVLAAQAREMWSLRFWDEGVVDHLMEGFDAACALAGTEAAGQPHPATSRPSSRQIEGYEKAQALLAESTSPPAPAKAPASGRTASIAVLPFTDMSAAKDQDWFCDGIAEEILNALSQLKGLRVAARGSAFSFKGKGEALHSIGEKLNVGTILEGSVRRAGDRVRITAQLSDVKDGFQLWSERYDREMKDIFDVQDEIAKSIAERLKVTLAGNGEGRLAARPTENIEAYEIYLRGRALLYKRGRYIVEARELFQRVVDLDPLYALAWAGLADADSIESILGMVRPEEARPRALAAAKRAIALDPSSSEAHNALASALLLFVSDREGARREYLKALELNPNNVQARCWYAVFQMQATEGRLQEGIAEARRALDADPLSTYAKAMLGTAVALAWRTDEALDILKGAREGDPGAFLPQWGTGVAFLWAGRAEEALGHLRISVQLAGFSGYAAADLTAALAATARASEAQETYARMTQMAASAYASPMSLANAAFAIGNRNEAIARARQALDERDPVFLLLARHWPSTKWLREQPEWPAMLKQLDAPPKIEA